MKSFEYVITDPVGIHARPAGILVKEIKKYASTVTVTKGEKSVNALKLMALMGMGIKQGDTVKSPWKARTRIPPSPPSRRSSRPTSNRRQCLHPVAAATD